MGKVIFTPEQKLFIDDISDDPNLSERFYFTGGTALSIFYLGHRFSEDLDFFSELDFDNDRVISFIENASKKLRAKNRFTIIENTRIFEIFKNKKLLVKVDFNYYPHSRLEKGKKFKHLNIDSLFDIAVNKLLTISQRTEVKDFVDLYYLFQKYTLWDLMEGVNKKFRIEIDPILIASNFLKVENFKHMPMMIKPLSLRSLQTFYTKRSKEIGKKLVR